MNILILGGNNHLSNSFIDKLLTLRQNFRIIVYDNNESLDNELKNNFCNVDKYFGYLVNNEYTKVYGDIHDREKLLETCESYNINFIINNIKFNPWKSKIQNIRKLNRIIENIQYCNEKLNFTRIIFINRFFSSDYYLLHKIKRLKQNSIEYGKTQLSFIKIYGLERITKYIDYTDNIISEDKYNNNVLFESFINMFKIQTKPYAHDVSVSFSYMNSIIAAMIMYVVYNDRLEQRNTINGYNMNIGYELIPTIISVICETRQDKEKKTLDFYSERKQNAYDMKLCKEDYVLESIKYSVNKIYE